MLFHNADPRYRYDTIGKRYPVMPGLVDDAYLTRLSGYYQPKQELNEYRKMNPICPKDGSHGQMRLHVVNPKGIGIYECVYGCTHPGCNENLRETIILH